jgi:hypothetical protein
MIRQLAAAAAVLWAWHTASAQAGDATRGGTLTVTIGAIQEYRRDDADSPIAYAGTGPAARIEYERIRPERRDYFALSGGAATLTPVGTVSDVDIPPLQEGFDAFDIRAGMQWRQRHLSRALGELSLGVEFDAALTLVRHAYAGQGTSHQSFDLGIATVAPTARWSRRVGAGDLVATIGVPLIALLDHPYADVRYAAQVTHFRLASLSSLRQADGGVSYEIAAGRGAGIIAQYRLSVLALDDFEPIRRVSQSLSLGMIRRFGRHP